MKAKISFIFIFLFLTNGAFAATGNSDKLCSYILEEKPNGCIDEKDSDEIVFSSIAVFILNLTKIFDYLDMFQL